MYKNVRVHNAIHNYIHVYMCELDYVNCIMYMNVYIIQFICPCVHVIWIM